ncbi:MAG: hypothetical protein NUW23_04210 [Firmicutes bacterium]|jgi:hypothetical protein|nr:hypothetical protein [Bacillota bacterium]
MTDERDSDIRRGRTTAGLLLIVIGGILLAAQIVDSRTMGLMVLPSIGLTFLIWGIVTRRAGLLVPGGILLGIGAGAYLVDLPFAAVEEPARGGIFLLAFAGGWVLISVASALFTPTAMWWPLVPGVVLAAIGGPLVLAGTAPEALAWMAKLWPVALILLGLVLLFTGLGVRK